MLLVAKGDVELAQGTQPAAIDSSNPRSRKRLSYQQPFSDSRVRTWLKEKLKRPESNWRSGLNP